MVSVTNHAIERLNPVYTHSCGERVATVAAAFCHLLVCVDVAARSGWALLPRGRGARS